MRMTIIAIAAATASLLAGAAQAACIYPRAPEQMPDGKTASETEMVESHRAVKQFNEDINAYNTCLELELNSLEQSGLYEEARLAELRIMQVKKNNAAVDEAQAVADRFNEQLRIYKAREKDE